MERLKLLVASAVVHLLELFSLLFKLLNNHRVIFDDLTLEVLSVFKCLLDLFLEILLILDSLVTVSYKLFSQFFDLIDLFLQLLNRLTLSFDHLFEIVAFED